MMFLKISLWRQPTLARTRILKSTWLHIVYKNMTLQWTIVAGVLYAEIAATFILLLPWVRPTLWSKLFKSRLFTALSKHAHIYSMTFGFVLFILFADGVRETMKYNELEDKMHRTAEADATYHMRLFRAQRNLYISGFSLLLWMVIQRIMTLLSRAAQLEAAGEAAMRQAENASKTARTLMNATETSEEVSDLNKQIEKLKGELKSVNTDRDTLKKQSEGLQREFDRVSDLLASSNSKGDKKKD
ncbi:hypothetical protein L3Y34_005805 [Caenorhabditis briggsae]|uniref:Endoplasmic reticulum transmembrane protein n=1 Tax=Caenorhabditis briggsae TaxID=6238 RepID=A0AAE9D810_CAEBR|nr:hypothetical protein L3Y34_005805 [Caenorhabditis briggsae]